MLKSAEYWIRHFGLIKHPEGGYYNETYRSDELISGESLPERFKGKYSFSTAIYYLLKSGDFSKFHRLKSDEIWHFYAGSPLNIFIIEQNGNLRKHLIGSGKENEELFQVLIPAMCWISAVPMEKDSYSLVGCTVAPGFEYKDLEFGNIDELIAQYPHHKEIIEMLT